MSELTVSDLARAGAYGAFGSYIIGAAFGALAATPTGRKFLFRKAIPKLLSGAWIASNYIRLFAPLASGGSGIGFGAGAGGVGAGTLTAAATGGYLLGAAAGTGISYGVWGEKGGEKH